MTEAKKRLKFQMKIESVQLTLRADSLDKCHFMTDLRGTTARF